MPVRTVADIWNTVAGHQYRNYLKQGHQRWLGDYKKNVGKRIRYPELSHEGAIKGLEFANEASLVNTLSNASQVGKSLYGRKGKGHRRL